MERKSWHMMMSGHLTRGVSHTEEGKQRKVYKMTLSLSCLVTKKTKPFWSNLHFLMFCFALEQQLMLTNKKRLKDSTSDR